MCATVATRAEERSLRSFWKSANAQFFAMISPASQRAAGIASNRQGSVWREEQVDLVAKRPRGLVVGGATVHDVRKYEFRSGATVHDVRLC